VPTIEFDLKLGMQDFTWDEYQAAVVAADEMAYRTFWGWDHLLPIEGDMDGPEHESYTALAALAVLTKRIRLGAHVTGVIYRNPALQIKMATQLDIIANGRFDWGIGAAWAEREFRAYNIPFPEPKVRIGTLRETLDLARLLWSGDPRKKVTFEGKYVQANDLFINPQPNQLPHPPIVIGGGGEQLTLRVVAKHADVWHGFGDIPTLTRKIDLIHTYAPDYGRDGREIVMSCNVDLWVGDVPAWARKLMGSGNSLIEGDAASIEKRLRPLVDAGIGRFVVSARRPEFADNWRRISDEVIPRFANG